jgi:hypothetical protein
VLRLRTSGAIPLLPLGAIMAWWTGKTTFFTLKWKMRTFSSTMTFVHIVPEIKRGFIITKTKMMIQYNVINSPEELVTKYKFQ